MEERNSVRGVPGTKKPLEISVKTVRKFGKNRKTAKKWTKPRTVGMLRTEKRHQNFGKTKKPQKIASSHKTANLRPPSPLVVMYLPYWFTIFVVMYLPYWFTCCMEL